MIRTKAAQMVMRVRSKVRAGQKNAAIPHPRLGAARALDSRLAGVRGGAPAEGRTPPCKREDRTAQGVARAKQQQRTRDDYLARSTSAGSVRPCCENCPSITATLIARQRLGAAGAADAGVCKAHSWVPARVSITRPRD